VLVAMFVPFAAAAAGLTIAKKSVVLKTKDWDISVQYPATGNGRVDAALADYARREIADFKSNKPDFAHGDSQYTLEITYRIERNDGKMLGIVFTEYRNTGGAHPNSNYTTFNFVLPEGYDVTLPEILDGTRGIRALAAIVRPRLMAKLVSGTEPVSDKDMVTEGTKPSDDNYADFI